MYCGLVAGTLDATLKFTHPRAVKDARRND
jgi:hypothetical protein